MVPKTKVCIQCRKRKRLKDFSVHHSGKFGRRARCRPCRTFWATQHPSYHHQPREKLTPETYHAFSCGCAGMLPKRKTSNQLVIWSGSGFMCRISMILSNSLKTSARGNYAPISSKTPHPGIRRLMRNPVCVRCNGPLKWDCFSRATTPHLHHNHETGEIYGFTHPHCNPRALEQENDRLREQIKQLKQYFRTIYKDLELR